MAVKKVHIADLGHYLRQKGGTIYVAQLDRTHIIYVYGMPGRHLQHYLNP